MNRNIKYKYIYKYIHIHIYICMYIYVPSNVCIMYTSTMKAASLGRGGGPAVCGPLRTLVICCIRSEGAEVRFSTATDLSANWCKRPLYVKTYMNVYVYIYIFVYANALTSPQIYKHRYSCVILYLDKDIQICIYTVV
jgi:hypothetical protein